MLTSLLVSLPSEMTSSAFFLWRPLCASGIASRHGVVHRGPAAREQPAQLRAHPRAVFRPPLNELRVRIEAIEEHLVLGSEQLEQEAIERLARGEHFFTVHAAARIEHDAQADGNALAVEVGDLLQLLVLEETEIFFVQSGHEAAGAVGDGRVDVDQLDAGAKPERLRTLLRLPRLLRHERRECRGHDERDDGDGFDFHGVPQPARLIHPFWRACPLPADRHAR